MKKIFLSGVLLISAFLTSCGSDDDGSENEVQENSAPNEAMLAISEESGLSVDLTWDEVTDIDGDVVTYDLYVNDVIVAADLTTVDYTWTAEGQNDVVYPVAFTVVSKDVNEGESTSNEVELDDPIIGVWYETSSAKVSEGGVIGDFEDAEDCNQKNFISFSEDNSYTTDGFEELSDIGECVFQTTIGTWENLETGNYLFAFEDASNDAPVVFEGNTIKLTSSDSSTIYTKQ